MHHIVHWQEDGRTRSARWAASRRNPLPEEILVAGDELRADHALRLATQNRAILWRGDYRNARQLLAAMGRRLTRRTTHYNGTPADIFHSHRQAMAHRAQLLNRLLVELGPDDNLALPHAPNVSAAYHQAELRRGPDGHPVLPPAPDASVAYWQVGDETELHESMDGHLALPHAPNVSAASQQAELRRGPDGHLVLPLAPNVSGASQQAELRRGADGHLVLPDAFAAYRPVGDESELRRGPESHLVLPPAPDASAYQQAGDHAEPRRAVDGHLDLAHAPGQQAELRQALDSHPDHPHAPGQRAGDQAGRGLLLPLRELLGMLGAHQWRIRGIQVPALSATIHPHYGVFAPTRQEYVDLVADLPWRPVRTAFDIGTGTGVLAVLLALRGATQVIATDIELRAVACARDNVSRFGLTNRIRVEHRDLFPRGRADLIVCNPPWLPAGATSSLEAAVYDPGARMLRRFVAEIPCHLNPGGEAWLILSDLAERLGLRDEPTGMFAEAGLTVVGRHDIRPRHNTRRRGDPLAEYRDAEVISLWRLRSGTTIPCTTP